MASVSIEEAQAKMPELIDRVHAGEELVITKDGRPVARLTVPIEQARKSRQLGTLRGSVTYMASDFDAPLNEFREYMP